MKDGISSKVQILKGVRVIYLHTGEQNLVALLNDLKGADTLNLIGMLELGCILLGVARWRTRIRVMQRGKTRVAGGLYRLGQSCLAAVSSKSLGFVW